MRTAKYYGRLVIAKEVTGDSAVVERPVLNHSDGQGSRSAFIEKYGDVFLHLDDRTFQITHNNFNRKGNCLLIRIGDLHLIIPCRQAGKKHG